MSINAGVSITDVDTTAQMTIGDIVQVQSGGALKSYMYVYNAGAIATYNGCGCYQNYTEGNITTNGTVVATRLLPAGIGVSAIPYQSYGFIQTWGRHTSARTNGDDDIAKGNLIVGASNASGLLDSRVVGAAAAVSAVPFGVAITADVDGSNTVDIFIDLFR